MSTRDVYDNMFFNTPIREWVTIVHDALTDIYGVDFNVEHGDFGFASYAHVIDAILSQVTAEDIKANGANTLKFIQCAHEAWSRHYIAYKQTHPGKVRRSHDDSVITHHRNERATTAVEHLSRFEYHVYKDIVEIIFKAITTKLLEVAMQNLNMG